MSILKEIRQVIGATRKGLKEALVMRPRKNKAYNSVNAAHLAQAYSNISFKKTRLCYDLAIAYPFKME